MIVRLGRKYRFFAAHRLFNPAASDADNARVYGKCSHPNGHGHTYSVDVVVGGPLDPTTQMIADLDQIDPLVQSVIDQLAYKQIERDVPEFAGRTSTTENVVAFLFSKLAPSIAALGLSLDRVECSETRNNHFEAYTQRTAA